MTRKTFWLIVIGSVIVVALIILAIVFHRYFDEISAAIRTFMLDLEGQNIFIMSLALFALQLPFQLLFFPGYSLFVVVVSYYMKGVFTVFAILLLTVAIWTVIAYYIFKLYLKSLLEEYFEDEQLFHWIGQKSRESQWKTSILVRSLFFSNIYKNIVLVVVGIDFWPFYIPAMAYYVIYIACFMVVGKSISTVRDYYKGDIKSDDPRLKLMLIFFPIVFVLSLTLLIVIFVYGYMEYREYQQNQAAQPLNPEPQAELKPEGEADKSADSKPRDTVKMSAEALRAEGF